MGLGHVNHFNPDGSWMPGCLVAAGTSQGDLAAPAGAP
jgi:hypothetical protein